MAATLFLVTAFWWVAYRLDAWSSPALLAGLAAPMGAQIALHWSFRWFAAARGRLAIYFALQLSLIILFGEVGRSDPWMYQFLLMLLAEAVAVLRSPRAQTAAAGIQVELERLTLAAERQRLARELHDTLAQGLVGLTLQLEALDAHLGRGEVPKSIAIVRGAAARARSTLADARTAIADLRATSAPPLAEALREEADRFSSATGIPCVVTVDAPLVRRGTRQGDRR